jgi:TolB-like protein/DNA-binding winged helix-turn-helix (wHTH) protein/Tfp pilus assembly protein PilF
MDYDSSAADPEPHSMAPGRDMALRIGNWRVDPTLNEISSGDKVVKLEPRNMRLLLYLASHAGRVVGLDELLREIWPNVIVTPQSVYNTVAQLRVSLGDSHDVPTYIVTVARKGYRLIAKVENRQVERRAAAGSPQPGSMPPTSASTPGGVIQPARSRLTEPKTLGVIIVTVLVLIGFGAVPVLMRTGIFGSRTASESAAHSIAVMPFKDLSEAKDREYLAEGLAEEIGTVLSRVPTLRVIGRASAFASRSDSVPDIAKKLHVDHVLEGSVQTSANSVRITAALIRTDSGQYLWSKTYDRANNDYFSVEDEIARDIAGALTSTALPPNKAASTCGQSGAAYNLMLQGRYLGRRNTRAERDRSIELYQQAVALEPNCARAWAWLSTAYGVQANLGWVARDLGYQRARDAAEHALRLDPLEADAHAALAYVDEAYDWNWSAADTELKRALELNAGSVRVLNMNGHLAMDLGQTDRAINFYRRAADQDPLSPGALIGLAAALWSRGQLGEAEAVYRRAAALSPVMVQAWIAFVVLERGDRTAARVEIEQETDPALRLMGLCIIESALGDRAASDRALAELVAKYSDQPYHIATVYAHRGDPDSAFQWLERAFTQHDPQMMQLKLGLVLRPVRRDPRYNALLRRMGLPPN